LGSDGLRNSGVPYRGLDSNDSSRPQGELAALRTALAMDSHGARHLPRVKACGRNMDPSARANARTSSSYACISSRANAWQSPTGFHLGSYGGALPPQRCRRTPARNFRLDAIPRPKTRLTPCRRSQRKRCRPAHAKGSSWAKARSNGRRRTAAHPPRVLTGERE
jgi:hypothetical protein